MGTSSDVPGVVLDRRCLDAVIFDMDGVITDTARVHFAAWKRVLDEFLVAHADMPGATSPFGEDDYRRYVDGKQRDDGVESFLAARGITLPRGAFSDPPDQLSVWGLANRKNAQFQQSIHEEGVVAYTSPVSQA